MKRLLEFLINSKSTGIISDSDFVDLGLESGTLWAKCNVGANNPGEIGNYYMWADTGDYRENKWFCLGECPYCNNYKEEKEKSSWDKYFEYDKLESSDDIAFLTTKGKMCIPSKENFKELEENTIVKWTKYNRRIQGKTYISKKDKTKSIFIPAGGYRRYERKYEIGKECWLWCNEIYNSVFWGAWSTCINIINKETKQFGISRCTGVNIRPIKYV